MAALTDVQLLGEFALRAGSRVVLDESWKRVDHLYGDRPYAEVERSVSDALAQAEAAGRHRYELEVNGDGCRVRYAFRQESLADPMLRLSLPVIRDMTWKVGMPMMMRPGLRNLVRAAEARAAGPLLLDQAG